MPPIKDPKKKWAVVLCKLDGSHPSSDVTQRFRDWFALSGTPTRYTIADFWHDQSFGEIDVSQTDVIDWLPCGWGVLASPIAHASYPGVDQSLGGARSRYRDLAIEVLNTSRGPNDYRGVICVFNFPVDGGNIGNDVVHGLGGVAGDLDWAESGWAQCIRCNVLVRFGAAAKTGVCLQGSTHNRGASQHLVPTDAALDQAGGPFRLCGNCGGLYLSGGTTTSMCPAGGAHQAASPTEYRLMSNWASTIGDDNWRLCSACGLVVRGDVESPFAPCPGTGASHQTRASPKLGTCYVDYGLDRDFFLHEMGHAFDFHHGRSSDPQSSDLANDCNPGAYRDPFDIMSYANVYASTDTWGGRGPSLAIHQREYAGVVLAGWVETVQPPGGSVKLRPVARPELGGVAVAHVGDLTVEYRAASGWDEGLSLPGRVEGSGAVLVYDTATPDSMLLDSTKGRNYLAAGDTLETTRPGGAGGWTITVRSMTSDAAHIDASYEQVFSSRWQRWLVLPCSYAAASGTATTPLGIDDIAQLFVHDGGIESFWNEMAAGAHFVAATWTVSAKGNLSRDWIDLGYTAQIDQARSPADRVRAAIDVVLALKNPTQTTAPLYLDWRGFTGIIVVRNEDVGDGYLGQLKLPTGNTLPYRVECDKEMKTGGAAGDRRFDVIELGSGALEHARIAREIGRSLGLAEAPDDRFTVMSIHPQPYSFDNPIPDWGRTGPALDTDALATLGWLPDEQIRHVSVPQGQRLAGGSVLLVPWSVATHRSRWGTRHRLPPIVRLEIGPLSFECRTRDGWDRGFPPELQEVVLARRKDEDTPTALVEGQSIGWGGALREISGGGEVRVTSLSADGAELQYYMLEATPLVAGGGKLGAGGTILFTPDGRIIRIPPGDPVEREIAPILDAVSALIARIRQSHPFEHVDSPAVVAGVGRTADGQAILFGRDGILAIRRDDELERELAPQIDGIAAFARRARHAFSP